MKYEHRKHDLLPKQHFYLRLASHAVMAAILISFSLCVGVFGYHYFAQLPLIDSLLNASMILGGMGPVDRIETTSGKIFASFYALFSGLMLIAIVGILIAPVIHRFLHKFHLESESKKD
jgi:hypothetical protein